MSLQPSRILIILVTALYVGAVICVSFTPFAWSFKLLIILAIGLHYYFISSRYLFLSTNAAIVKLIWLEGAEWKLIQKDGTVVYADLQGNSFLSANLAILNFKSEDATYKASVVIGADSMLMQNFRLLKMQILV